MRRSRRAPRRPVTTSRSRRASTRASNRSAIVLPRCAARGRRAFRFISCEPTSPATSPSGSAPPASACRVTAAPVPRWIVHHAFATPGRVVAQVAALPEGDAYLFMARAHGCARRRPAPAVMIGAAPAHARQFVQADGFALAHPASPFPSALPAASARAKIAATALSIASRFPASRREPDDRAAVGG